MKKFDELKALAEKNKHIRYYSEHPELQEDVTWFTAANPQTILALLADREQLREALEADVRIIGGFLDRLTPEAVGQPELSTAHLGMLEAMHCFKRAREALKKSDEVE